MTTADSDNQKAPDDQPTATIEGTPAEDATAGDVDVADGSTDGASGEASSRPAEKTSRSRATKKSGSSAAGRRSGSKKPLKGGPKSPPRSAGSSPAPDPTADEDDELNKLPANGEALSLVEGFTTIDVGDIDVRDSIDDGAGPESGGGDGDDGDSELANPELVHSVVINQPQIPEDVITTVASRTAGSGSERTQGDLLLERPFTGRLPKEFSARDVTLVQTSGASSVGRSATIRATCLIGFGPVGAPSPSTSCPRSKHRWSGTTPRSGAAWPTSLKPEPKLVGRLTCQTPRWTIWSSNWPSTSWIGFGFPPSASSMRTPQPTGSGYWNRSGPSTGTSETLACPTSARTRCTRRLLSGSTI